MTLKNIALALAAAAMALTGCGNVEKQTDEAMDFLYEYMNLADKADYSEDFFRQNTEVALKARREMPWGKQVPDQLFRHFVLPVRVNNERLDEFRMMYYDTLKARVAGMSMHDAALEINHWCHEKVTYTPSDPRTSSPMASMLNGEGRCGEESTFTVAAMRTMGIPARQVYTPRWAHTDDNHAWVEVWTDGKWSFLGACEPEPELNMAWFNEPAARAMLMHTLVLGDYRGPEDVIRRTKNFTEINVIGNYVRTRRNIVTVIDTEGKPVPGAYVSFCIYNYGELYNAVILKTDDEGKASLHSGIGDMFVWASDKGLYGTGKLTSDGDENVKNPEADLTAEVTVTLNHKDADKIELDIDINPPAPGRIPAEASEEDIAANKLRLAQEDSIRLAYVATFTTEANASERLGMPGLSAEDAEAACRQLIDARGNWRDVREFIFKANDAGKLKDALEMLKTLSRKDLRDTKCDVLMDALTTAAPRNAVSSRGENVYYNYVLCPRISGEFIQPYHQDIRKALASYLIYSNGTPRDIASKADAEKLAGEIIRWTRDSVALADSLNSRRLQATPAGTLRMRMADNRSRNTFMVAALRTFGIPARVDQMTGKAQYMTDNEWIDITAEKQGDSSVGRVSEKGTFTLKYTPGAGTLDNPEYYRHFTLSKISNGRTRLLDFEGGDATELGADASARSFGKPFTLDAGSYLLTSGTRLASGKVLARMVSFNVAPGKNTDVALVMRQASEEISVIGEMDPEALYQPVTADGTVDVAKSILSTTGRGYFLVAVFGDGDEPSNHAIRDFESMSKELAAWGRPVMVFGQNVDNVKNLAGRLATADNQDLVHFGLDSDAAVRNMVCDGCHSASKTLPVIAMCDSFGRVVYLSTGYNTSLASQLRNVIAGI